MVKNLAKVSCSKVAGANLRKVHEKFEGKIFEKRDEHEKANIVRNFRGGSRYAGLLDWDRDTGTGNTDTGARR